MRAASVVCTTPVEVMAMDRQVFNQVAGGGVDSKLSISMQERAEERQRARLLKVLTSASLANQQRRLFPKGDIIYQQGDHASHFYVLESGELEMSVNTSDGRSVRVRKLKQGDHFGYDALLSDVHDATVTVTKEAEVTAVAQSELRLASKNDEYLLQTASAQRERQQEAQRAMLSPESEAQILPMMARAAAAGDGLEFDKYEAMLSKMQPLKLSDGATVFNQGDEATSVYVVTAGKLNAEVGASDGGAGGRRVVATLGPGDHFGETALLEDRQFRNATVRCVTPVCELKAMANERFAECLRESTQLADAVQRAAKARTHQRVRKAIRAAADDGKASTVQLAPGDVIFRQGDRSGAFYLIERGEVQMSLRPDGEDEDDESPQEIPVRKYGIGECFGASGLMAGDGTRRNTATALSEVTLKVIPHKHFRVMLRDDNFLKAGLQGASKLQHKMEANKKMFDEMDDEVVLKSMRK